MPHGDCLSEQVLFWGHVQYNTYVPCNTTAKVGGARNRLRDSEMVLFFRAAVFADVTETGTTSVAETLEPARVLLCLGFIRAQCECLVASNRNP